ncbi:MAG: PepSY domain-containing protein [Cognaticolwellia sp.]
MKKQLFMLSLLSSLIATPVLARVDATLDNVTAVQVKYAKSKKAKSLSAQQAARIVKSKYGGKVLKVKNSGSRNNPSYRVKLLKDNGHVISVSVDGRSGRVSGR